MSEAVFTPLSSVLNDGGNSPDNAYLAAVKETFANFECWRHASYPEEFLTDYIRNHAIETEIKSHGRTYLYLMPNGDSKFDLAGFFELSLTGVRLKDVQADAREGVKGRGMKRRDGCLHTV